MRPALSVLCAALLASSVTGLVPPGVSTVVTQQRGVARWSPAPGPQLRMSSTDDSAIIPVSEETIATSASVSSAAAGLIIGGPVFALIAAVAGNYVVKQDGEVSDALKGVGKVSLDVVNFLLKLNKKYDLTTKASDATSSAIASIKEKDSEGTIGKVETVLGDATSKVKTLNSEYDLVEKSKQALAYASDLSVQAIDKGLELNKEYGIVDKVTETVKTTVSKGVEAAKKAA